MSTLERDCQIVGVIRPIATIEFHDTEDFNKANAHLIASAPELLEACKIGIVFSEALRRKTPTLWNDSDESDLNKMKQAIAKAEGK
jgi:poly-gamma-glutamate capsule biosynthesis protein CapA/YwtB (metallophosphatase superfamily)